MKTGDGQQPPGAPPPPQAWPSVHEREVAALLKSMGATDYEPRVVMQLAERLRRYVADLLYDAKDYANHAGRAEVETSDVKLSVQERQAGLATAAPQSSEMLELAAEVNSRPLPPIPDQFGVRLPPKGFCLTAPSLQLLPGKEALDRTDRAIAAAAAAAEAKRKAAELAAAGGGAAQRGPDGQPPAKARRVHNKQSPRPLMIRIKSSALS